MKKIQKQKALNYINFILIGTKIPYEYNKTELTIKVQGVDFTDSLLELYFYYDEYISNLIKEKIEKVKENEKLEKELKDANAKVAYLACKPKGEDKGIGWIDTADIEIKLAEAKLLIRESMSLCMSDNSNMAILKLKKAYYEKAERFLKEFE